MSLSHLELELLVLCEDWRSVTTTQVRGELKGAAPEAVEPALVRLRDAGLLLSRRVLSSMSGGPLRSDGTLPDPIDYEDDGWWTTEAGIAALDAHVAAALADGRTVPRLRLYLMPEYTSTSLWWERGGMVDLDQLPLTAATKEALVMWSRMMDTWLNGITGDAPFDEEAHGVQSVAEGDRLLAALRAELPARYQVGRPRYVDGRKQIDWG